ncbi:hypothetical protein K040078D81_09370 [Blautia hominis]|uniref:Uncharacterized protein n=1 Tax=Blautia hominis TaxID=2025493 RepID=A0ABQ0B5T8_9FIRM
MSAAGGSARRSTKPAESGPVSLPAPPRRSFPDFGCGSVGSMNEGAITLEDLDDFSEDLKDTMIHFFERK